SCHEETTVSGRLSRGLLTGSSTSRGRLRQRGGSSRRKRSAAARRTTTTTAQISRPGAITTHRESPCSSLLEGSKSVLGTRQAWVAWPRSLAYQFGVAGPCSRVVDFRRTGRLDAVADSGGER